MNKLRKNDDNGNGSYLSSIEERAQREDRASSLPQVDEVVKESPRRMEEKRN
jgi:hypothetical protein